MKHILTSMNKIPKYLTKRNESFRRIIHEALSVMAVAVTNHSVEKLRKIAISIYQIMFIQAYQALWKTYQKSVRGQLIEPSVEQLSYASNWSIYPKELKAMLTSPKLKGTKKDEVHMDFIEDVLNELDDLLKQYHVELNTRSNDFTNCTSTIQRMMERYIEENLHSLRVNIDHQIELVYHDYHIQALQLEYERHRPNTAQVCLFHPKSCQRSFLITVSFI